MSRSKKIWLSAAGLILLLPIMLVITLWLLVSTPGGTKWLFDQGINIAEAQHIQVRYAAIRGTLLERLELDQLQVILGSGEAEQTATDEISLGEFIFQWQPAKLFDGIVSIDLLRLDNLLVNMQSAQESEPAAVIQIPDLILPFEVELKQLEISRVYLGSYETSAVVDKLALQAVLDRNALSISSIQFLNEQAAVNGQLQSAVSAPHKIEGSFEIKADLPDQMQSSSRVDISGEMLKPEVNASLVLPFKADLQATVDIGQEQPSFNLQARWPEVQWPLQGEALVTSSAGQFSAKGHVDDFQLQLSTALQGQQLPATGLNLTASGNTSKITFQEILLKTLEGNILLKGDLGISPDIDWNFSVVSEGINPGVIDPQFQGKLNGQFSVEGQLQGEQISSKVSIAEISGQLRDYPLELSGDLEYLNNRIAAQDLKLNIGDNRLLLTGSIAERMDFDVDIQAPRLDQLYPQLSGGISGKARLAGKPDLPDIDFNLDATEIIYQDNDFGHLVFTGEWQQKQGHLKLQGENIVMAGEMVDHLNVQLDGEFASHNVNIKLDAPDKSLALQIDGALAADFSSWKARINQFDAGVQAFKWRLKAPADLLVSAQQYQLKTLCLVGENEDICLEGNWLAKQQQLKADATLSNYDLNQLKPFLPEGLNIAGQVSGNLHAEGKLDNIRANASLNPSDGVIKFKDEEEEFNISYRDVVLKADFENDEANIQLNFLLGENGKGNGNFKIGKSPERKLNGKLTASLPDLRIVQGFVPDLQDFNGKLDMDMKLAGKLAEPVINGKLKLYDAKANIPAAGIELKDISLVLEADDSRYLTLLAQVNSGEGNLKADGRIDASSFPADIQLHIQGEKFQVSRLPEAIVEISPDLKLAGKEMLKLSGQLIIPTAKIEVQQVPDSAVKVSRDEVIVGQEVEREKARNINADINLKLGEDVSFKGFGLQTGLTGNVDATFDGKTSRLFGKIEMKNAQYSAFGQTLDVEKGRFLFAGPADNPGIDLKAKRTSVDKSVTAYLNVSGQASNPKISVYSDPSLPEAEALSYLVTGRPMNQARGDSGSELSAAALSLGLTKTMPALKRIQESTGLDDFRIDSGSGDIEGTSLMMGKYLNPDLYIGYVYGLFDAQGGVKVSYSLTERIEVESFSGEKQSVDIYYRYEHD